MDLLVKMFSALSGDFGLGLTAVLLAVLWKVLRYIKEQHRERIEEQKTTIALLAEVKNWLESNDRVMSRVANKLGEVSEKLERLSGKLDIMAERLD